MTESGPTDGPSRRAFLKSAVAVGGSAALSACLDLVPTAESGTDVPEGTDPATLPDRQHAWGAHVPNDEHGNEVPPRHRVVLSLDYAGDGTPDREERSTVEAAFQSLERAYEWSNRGLLFTVSYSRRYFDRFDAALDIDLPRPEPLAPFENPEPDEPDALLHLASDHAHVVLAAEEALRGNRETVNGREATGLADVLEPVDRRTGFIGAGLPADNQNVDGVPDSKPVDEESPLYMGFESGFAGSQATEDRVTIESGAFAGGTTQHLSTLSLNLQQWYEQDSRFQRVGRMFSPHHAAEQMVEGTGDNLGSTNRALSAPDPMESARTDGMVGHAQKNARAREDGAPVILRRDFDSTDGGRAGVHFLSLQESIADFVATREAMNGTDVAANSAVGTRNNNGILQYIDVERRGNFLVPPRSSRALPTPTGEA